MKIFKYIKGLFNGQRKVKGVPVLYMAELSTYHLPRVDRLKLQRPGAPFFVGTDHEFDGYIFHVIYDFPFEQMEEKLQRMKFTEETVDLFRMLHTRKIPYVKFSTLTPMTKHIELLTNT